MNKIPVGQTIAQTYAFAFRHYLANLGVVWLPFLLLGAAAYYVLMPTLTAMTAFMNDVAQHALQNPGTPYLPASFGQVMRGFAQFYILTLFILPLIAVGVTKEALGTRESPRFLYLAVGKRELLVLGGIFTLLALYLGAIVVMGVAMGIVGGIVGIIAGLVVGGAPAGRSDPAAAVAATLPFVRAFVLLFYLVFVYFFVRLVFLMVPATVAESRFGVWRSWELTRGNFWRSLAVILGTFLPITIAFYALWFAVFGPGIFQYMSDSLLNPQRAGNELAAGIGLVKRYGLYFWIFGLALAPISYGLMFGQSAFAYRALTGDGQRR